MYIMIIQVKSVFRSYIFRKLHQGTAAERLLKRRVPVTDMKSSTTSGIRHSSESSKSKERKTSKERKIEEEIKVADVDSIIKENLPVPEDREVGQFQMNDLMTRVLEDELQTIMIEIWRALPDDPPSRTEKYVADKLRNEVSDDLRNVLGLNVTKRLLNVYNPLYVKLYFSHRPESGCLTKFLNSFNAEIFKRINREKSKNTFVARLKSISDFDKICTSQHIRCGTARITVAPFYNFTKCPAKLNTIFADNGAVENKDNENNSNDYITNDDEGETIVKESNVEETTVVDKKSSVEDNKTSAPQKKPNKEVKKTLPEKKLKSEEETSVPQKKTDIGEVKTTVPQKKTVIVKVNIAVPKRKSNIEQSIKSVSDKKSNIEAAKKTEEVKSVPEKKPNVKVNKKSVLEKKPNIKKGKNSVSGKKPIVNEVKKLVTQKKSPNVKTQSQTGVKKTLKKIDNRDFEIDQTEIVDEIGEYDDDDEMNDEEILALIAGGVVVDECSGSDVE